MYIVKLINGNNTTEIHGMKQKLKSGNIVKGINTIDSFSFSMLPTNAGFNRIYNYQTLVNVFNTNTNKYEYYGRVIYPYNAMDSSGLIWKEVTCESFLGFLCDSQQTYVAERNWAVRELLEYLVDVHNSKTEDYKHFVVGEVTVTDPNDNLYLGVQRENTWDAIKKKLIDKLGGELSFRVVDGIIYLDYLEQIGTTVSTKIALSKNMKSITKEDDPTSYITRLIPLGAKLKVEETTTDASGNEVTQLVESEERVDITSVNDGLEYIEDETGFAAYGIHEEYEYFDDVTDPATLLKKGKEFLADHNKLQIKYSITALNLSLIGLDYDDFEVGNYHPIENALLGISDVARIIKKNINVCVETSSTIEVGDNFKTLSDLQVEQLQNTENLMNTVEKIESNYVTNEALKSESQMLSSLIQQSVEKIVLSVNETYVTESEAEELRESIETELSILSDAILMNFTTTTEQIESVDGNLQTKFNELYKYISFSEDGITIGSSENGLTLSLDNDAIAFKRNGIQFGWWDGVDFHTGNIVVEVNERAQFGNFAFVPRSDGSLSFLKVGE